MRSALFLAVFAVASARGGCTPSEPPPYDPCASSACGDPCRVCPPDDAGCFETAVVKACDGAGLCVPAPVDCAPLPYDPCAGKGCGELCDPCTPGTPCPMYFAATACDHAGQCVTAGTFTCEPPPPPPPTDPCAGKLCGDDCVIDPPCAPLCLMPSILGKCDPAGSCQPLTEVKCEPPTPPDPCAGKLCGDACSTCTPTAGVLCPAVMMYCDAAGACGYAYPVCPG